MICSRAWRAPTRLAQGPDSAEGGILGWGGRALHVAP